MSNIPGLVELHQLCRGNAEISIAVLDGPVDLQHSCFNVSGGILMPLDSMEVVPSAAIGLALNHGTAVCSLIFGKHGSEVEGVAPGCKGLIIPIYSEDEKGNFSSASQLDLARAIEKAIEKGANIINISGGQYSKTGDPDLFLKHAIEKCFKKGILIVAATGNEGCNCLHVPAADKQVLAVGSMDENGEPTSETNFGVSYQLNGILAQGKGLRAARAGGGTYVTNGGTSYATPIVSGVVGLLMSLQIKEGLQPDAYAIRSILESTAIPCVGDGKNDCRRFLRGKLNLPAALAEIRKNPGILASGIEVTPIKSIDMTTPSTPIPIESTAIELNALAVEPACGVCEKEKPVADINQAGIDPAENMTGQLNGEVDGSGSEVEGLAPDNREEHNSRVDISRNILSAEPADKEITLSGKNTPLININYLKPENMQQTEKMENIKTSQDAVDQLTVAPSLTPSGEIDPSDCGCGGAKADPDQIVYALGTLGYDFGSESHRDSFTQSMGGANPYDPAAILKYLNSNPWDAAEIIWTLNIDATPIYALYPTGAHAAAGFERLRNYLKEQANGNIQRISVPGFAKGSSSLLMGHSVKNLFPTLRGMYSWTTQALLDATTSGAKGSSKALAENVGNFLNRIYYKMRNLGVSAEERALNYSATNAYQVSSVFSAALKESLELDDITAEKSPICRPGSDCYDVVLSFFNPKERLTVARKEYRFTVDVSDVVPVTVGEVRAWSVY